jgi:hypothetical protein
MICFFESQKDDNVAAGSEVSSVQIDQKNKYLQVINL